MEKEKKKNWEKRVGREIKENLKRNIYFFSLFPSLSATINFPEGRLFADQRQISIDIIVQ